MNVPFQTGEEYRTRTNTDENLFSAFVRVRPRPKVLEIWFLADQSREYLSTTQGLKPLGLSLALLATRRASETYGVLTDALYGKPHSD
jgi:hypothetical protein